MTGKFAGTPFEGMNLLSSIHLAISIDRMKFQWKIINNRLLTDCNRILANGSHWVERALSANIKSGWLSENYLVICTIYLGPVTVPCSSGLILRLVTDLDLD